MLANVGSAVTTYLKSNRTRGLRCHFQLLAEADLPGWYRVWDEGSRDPEFIGDAMRLPSYAITQLVTFGITGFLLRVLVCGRTA